MIAVGLFLLSLGAAVVFAWVFEDEIVSEVERSLGEYLTVPMVIGDTDFSLLSDFPSASVVMEDVHLRDPLRIGDTLLFAERLALELNVLDVLRKEYTVQHLSIENALVDMYRDKDGAVNYIVWERPDSLQSSSAFDIDDIRLDDVVYRYTDDRADIQLVTHLAMGGAALTSDGSMVLMQVDLDASRTDLVVAAQPFVSAEPIDLSGKVATTLKGDSVVFEGMDLRIDEMVTSVVGSVWEEEFWTTSLQGVSEGEIEQILTGVPEAYLGWKESYGISGSMDLDWTVQGTLEAENRPRLDVDMYVKDGVLRDLENGHSVRAIEMKGDYARAPNGWDRLDFNSCTAELEGGTLSYVGRLANTRNPHLDGHLDIHADFLAVSELLRLDVWTEAEGTFSLAVDIEGRVPDDGTLGDLDLFGTLELKRMGMLLNDPAYRIREVDGEILLKDGILFMDSMSVRCNGDQLAIEGQLDGLIAKLSGSTSPLRFKGSLSSPSIDWSRWAAKEETEGSADTLRLPESIELDAVLEIGRFQHRSFTAEDIRALFKMDAGVVGLENLSLNACGGELSGQWNLRQQNDLNWVMESRVDVRSMDIPVLFDSFEQFGQDFLVSKHISGSGNADATLRMLLGNGLDPLTESLILDAQAVIRKGELKEHPSMTEMITTLREKNLLRPFVRADELEREVRHLRFETLSNTISIRDGSIEIPEMTLDNNAMAINISGVHRFNNEIDYQVDFNLRDVLINKKNPAFLIEDDGLGHRIHLRMYGTASDPIIELDKDRVKQNRKEAIAEAKEDIKEFLRNPFKKGDEEERDDRSKVKIEIEQEQDSIPKAGEKQKDSGGFEFILEDDEEGEDDDDF